MSYDLLIRNGRVIDGTGMPWTRADIGVSRGKIRRVGNLSRARATTEIDANGRYVTPGFVDIHTHSDVGVLLDPTCECAVRQGVTTHLIGNCGDSAAPVGDTTRDLLERRLAYYGRGLPFTWSSFADYLARLEAATPAINIAALVGHNTVRIAVLGMEALEPTKAQLKEMSGLVTDSMRAGAFGLSTGLVYPPGCFATTDEIVALAKIVARFHGYYASHIRGERETVVEAVKECLEIGERAGCAVQISHNNPKYGGWGKAKEIQALWEEARERGIDVTVDNDIHTDFGPPLKMALPQWTQKLKDDEIVRLLSDPAGRKRVKAEIKADATPAFGPAGLLVHERFDRIWILHNPKNPALEGRTLEVLAKERGTDPWTILFDVIQHDMTEAVGLFDYQDLEEIKATVSHRLCMICSDGWVLPRSGASVTPPPYIPCSYGEFPGVLARFVRDEKVLRLEEAVRKMTSMPAARLRLQDRGIIREGLAADITIFDLEKVKDNATNLFPHANPRENYPHAYPEGIDYVIVNGRLTVALNELQPTRAGQVLRHRPS